MGSDTSKDLLLKYVFSRFKNIQITVKWECAYIKKIKQKNRKQVKEKFNKKKSEE